MFQSLCCLIGNLTMWWVCLRTRLLRQLFIVDGLSLSHCFTDNNECNSAPCAEVCVNTEGSFYCACNETGYMVVTDSEPCIGKDFLCY